MSDKKKKGNKKKEPVKVKKTIMPEWFFMSRKTVDVLAIKDVLSAMEKADLEIWKEMGVLECVIPEQCSFDMELLECDLQEEESNAFLAKHNIKSLYALNVEAETMEQIEPVMKLLAEKLDGFCCADTDDFEPVIE